MSTKTVITSDKHQLTAFTRKIKSFVDDFIDKSTVKDPWKDTYTDWVNNRFGDGTRTMSRFQISKIVLGTSKTVADWSLAKIIMTIKNTLLPVNSSYKFTSDPTDTDLWYMEDKIDGTIAIKNTNDPVIPLTDTAWTTIPIKKGTQPSAAILTKTSIIPTRSTTDSVGYDLHLDSEQDITIPTGTIMPLPTGIAIQCPKGTYGRIAPCSGLTVKQHLTTLAGVIDPDYRGNVMVLIQNFGNEHQILKKGQRIAQLILENASTPPAEVVNDLIRTERGTQGFGSTEIRSKSIHFPIKQIAKLPSPKNPVVPIYEPTDIPTHHSHTAAAAKLFSDIQTTFEPSYDINLNTNPYDN
jgi:dUTP pyrophosphatase